jgi:hypothetical protein
VEVLQKRGETARQNWCGKLDRLKALGIAFPFTVPNHRQVEIIAQVRMCYGYASRCKMCIVNHQCVLFA